LYWGDDLILDCVVTGTEKKRGPQATVLILRGDLVNYNTSILCGL
jgi:hypothetical protein